MSDERKCRRLGLAGAALVADSTLIRTAILLEARSALVEERHQPHFLPNSRWLSLSQQTRETMSRTNANATDSDSEKARIGAAMRAQLKLASHVGFDSAATSCDDEREDALTLSQSIGRKSDIDPDQLLAQVRGRCVCRPSAAWCLARLGARGWLTGAVQLQALEADDGDAPPPASDAPARSTAGARATRPQKSEFYFPLVLIFFSLAFSSLLRPYLGCGGRARAAGAGRADRSADLSLLLLSDARSAGARVPLPGQGRGHVHRPGAWPPVVCRRSQKRKRSLGVLRSPPIRWSALWPASF